MTTKTVTVTVEVEVTVDETKFDPQFLRDFQKHMYASVKTIDDHIRFLGKCAATGIPLRDLDGYGDTAKDFGVAIKWNSTSAALEDE